MIKNYIKIAWRNLVKGKLFTVINIAGLALGIASVLLIFLYIQHEFSFDEYHENKDQIYRITSYGGFNEKDWGWYTPGDPIQEMRTNFAGVVDGVQMTNCSGGMVTVGEQHFEDLEIFCTESNLFNIFSFPLISRSREGVLDEPFTTVISRSTAGKLFGEEEPIGRSITFNWDDGKKDFEVTGVMEDIPANTHFQYDIFLSYNSLESTNRCLDCGELLYALLEEDADTAVIADQMLQHIREIDGKTYIEDIGLQPLEEIHFSSLGAQESGNWQYVQILFTIALVILLMGCSNYLNLTTASYLKRSKEIGIRKTMGAYRRQLTGQFLFETMILTFVTVPVAIILLEVAIPWFNIYAQTALNLSLGENLWFYIALTGVLLFTGLLAGFYPSQFVSAFQPNEVLKGQRGMGFGGGLLRKGLVIFQFFASIVLVAATILIFRQLQYVQTKNLGFDSDQLVRVIINDPVLALQGNSIKQEFLRQSDVVAVTASLTPSAGRFANISHVFDSDTVEGKRHTFATPRIDSDFIRTMDIELLAGRNIEPGISGERQRISEVLINETGAIELGFTSYENILNRVFGERYRIVGVVEDFHMESLQEEIKPAFYEPNPFSITPVVNVRLAGGNIIRGIESLRSAWSNLGATTPLDYAFVDELIQQQYEQEQRTAWVIGVFTALSIIIACLGLFGLAAYTAERRTKEIGIRKVLGATVANIVTLLSKDFVKLVLLGFVIAVPIAWYAMNLWLQDFAYKIEIEPGIFVLAGGVALLIALATVSWQSVRAALANPVESLRSE